MPFMNRCNKALLDEYQLVSRPLRQHSGDDETAVIGDLGEAIGRCDVYAEIPVMLAKAATLLS